MATRLSVITTRTGDQGTTGLGDGSRVPKDAPRIAALGDVDELNSMLGLLRTETLPAQIDAVLEQVQNDLFDMGAELCIPGHVALKHEHVLFLEQALAEHNAELGKLEEFILPGGTRAAALAHVARTICRRAERAVVALNNDETPAPDSTGAVNEPVRQYLNRLSDLCFVLARALNRAAGQPDVQWGRQARP
ncbi:cob(I)yrinic acid a,c-diamide adenosyltransferase [Pollutimonas thiosulfatoxidans]|uniref:Cobalamin adenosyltransferase n=1 Tax=Pollutimonas thiosulfatoxidans TaxID=2028345 RepID=A0A410GE11_9BURK|nr:cob(I)yrinic acid a,c-diamide adenosyltransferase [Pollutimonas thiosulfatoxidans]QAA94532.1 ATP:cob(I)alamin adenosyltransferase [Pollutimonas thiosulfatoxidans]